MVLELIGKTAPLPNELQRAADDGFKKIELFMREGFLTDRHLKFLSDASRENGLEYYSIHTPHSKPSVFLEILKRTKVFARRASIPVIVVHSSHVDVFSKRVLSNVEGRMFPENGLNHNLPFLEKFFKSGGGLCLDTAHFYVASVSSGRDYYRDMGTLFKKYAEQIGHLHIADATEDFVGKPLIDEQENYDTNISEGEIDFFKIMPIISKCYNGVAVVEVDVDKQVDGIKKLNNILSLKTKRKSVPKVSRRQPKS